GEERELVVSREGDEVVEVLLGARRAEEDDPELERLAVRRRLDEPPRVRPHVVGADLLLLREPLEDRVGVGAAVVVEEDRAQAGARRSPPAAGEPPERLEDGASRLELRLVRCRAEVVRGDAVPRPRRRAELALAGPAVLVVGELQPDSTIPA